MEESPFGNLYIFRYVSIENNSLTSAASELVDKTTYRRTALREEAPSITDCLTSIHYIFKKAFGLEIPLTYIGDMPRQLLSSNSWKPLKIDINQAQCGDLLFVKSTQYTKQLSHVAMFITADKIFHCNLASGTAVIQSPEQFFHFYEQKLNFIHMIRYIDPRNKKLREDHQGGFITD